MMFSAFVLKQKSAIRTLAVFLMLVIIIVNVLEMQSFIFIKIDLKGLMLFDKFALLFTTIAYTSTLFFFLLSAKDMEKVGVNYSDYFALIFFILCGIALAASFKSMLILFLGIEIISIPLYILTGSDKRNLKSNEASLKYFLMGAFSTGLMLMGITLVYGATGTFDTAKMQVGTGDISVLMVVGLLMLLFSMSFKVSAAPFHFWTPDVYDGAPTVFTSFMATIVKAAGFIAFVRLFEEAFGTLQNEWKLFVAIITAATLFIGNITAVFQQSIKRMLAYSSIAQAGFMMMAVYSVNSDAFEGIIFYSAAYSVATIGIFGILIKMKDQTFNGFNGFAKQQPLIAAIVTIFLLSLAGIPLTAGFLAKFFMLKATLAANNIWLVVFAVLMAAISVYYYFKLIQAMYFKEGEPEYDEFNPAFKYTLIALASITIILGLFPDLLLHWLYF